ncbi:BTAD domain-containing putative transcriptional regulator [Streptomyces sp. RFCAC02]|uniref:AfsR/SARP family transcriptional regulator n=1 Tax=Streptomyces sp. RFCAC02 TaxID=2499143 RepID=UPI00101E96AD|nr:BTAD domain-containing putative transcriptional regulator [Streptomyces sp. RFCAC02]
MHYRILGPVSLTGPDGDLPLAGPKRRTVLAALLIDAGRVVSDQRLSDLLWGDDPPPSARGQIQVHISELRRLVGRDTIVRRPPGYLISVRPGELDLHVFDDAVQRARAELADGRAGPATDLLRDALALWHDPPLGGVTEPLRALEGPGLHERRLGALETWFGARLDAGLHAESVGELRRAAERHPFRERLTAQLMLALHRCGRTPEALAAYAATRARLRAEVGVEPGPLLRDTHAELLRGAQHGTPGGSADHGVLPRQLPPQPPSFTGRDSELARLDGLLAATPHPLPPVAVVGGAGVGKTALALHWAHRIRDRFPDGQLHADLRGSRPGEAPLDPADAAAGFLEALGIPPSHQPADGRARLALFRSALAGRRVLLLLDDARDAEAVRPLLPGRPGCLTVVTSRDRLAALVAAEGARPVPLGPLPPADARDLLARRIGADRVAAEPAAAERLAALSAGLPLALVAVAARAALDPDFPLDAPAGGAGGLLDVFEHGDPAAGVRAAFARSYDAAGADAARLFRLLGRHGDRPVTVASAAALLGEPEHRARALLAELTRVHLLTEHRPGRYGHHALLRAYAAELARGDCQW